MHVLQQQDKDQPVSSSVSASKTSSQLTIRKTIAKSTPFLNKNLIVKHKQLVDVIGNFIYQGLQPLSIHSG